jgi:hypothetical protein
VIYQTATGKGGLAAYNAHCIDCGVLEINLLDMSGFQVLPQLLNNGRSHAAPVSVLTHLTKLFSLLDLAVKKGACSALCKSFSAKPCHKKRCGSSLLPLLRTVDSSHSPSIAYDHPVILSARMSLMPLVSEFLRKGKELCQRMRSPEGTTLSRADLELLKDQLHHLHNEAVNLLSQKERRE